MEIQRCGMQKGSNDEYCKLSADSYIFESWLQWHFALSHYFTPNRKGLPKRTNIQIRLIYLSDYVFFVSSRIRRFMRWLSSCKYSSAVLFFLWIQTYNLIASMIYCCDSKLPIEGCFANSLDLHDRVGIII